MQKSGKKNEPFASKSEFWGICCESGKRYSQVVSKKFHISMAALDPTDTMTSPCVSLMVERDECQYLLCSLKPDSVLQVTLNLYFDKGENITFFLKGHGTVHLSGYYIYGETDAGSTENIKKGQVSTLAKKEGKKPHTNFIVSEDVDLESSDDDEDEEESSDEDLKNNKAAKGKAALPAKKVSIVSPAKKAIAKKADVSEDESSDESDSEEMNTSSDGKKFATNANKRMHSTVESEEESSDEEDDSSDDGLQKSEVLKGLFQSKKKFKADTSTPAQNNKMSQKAPVQKSANKSFGDLKTGKPDLDSSIGRTPMPKKSVSFTQKSSPIDAFLAEMKNQKKTPKKDSSDSEDMQTSPVKSPSKANNQLNTSAQSESSKKKKKKRKSKASADANQAENSQEAAKSPAKSQFSHKLPNGLEYEDIRVGNGLPAKRGKLVHVYYTGKLENNKVFDSCQQGSKPFSFKLASGQVIKGWDLGIEGMKVGGKRKLKIPPSLGYAGQRMGDIPPNSTLNFVVELKAVS